MSNNPSARAIAFNIWRHCDPLGWNCAVRDCALAIGETSATVRAVAVNKGWITVFRGAVQDDGIAPRKSIGVIQMHFDRFSRDEIAFATKSHQTLQQQEDYS